MIPVATPTVVKRDSKQEAKQLRERQAIADMSGFLGDSVLDHPDSCSNAQIYILSQGQLVQGTRALSVDPGVDYINMITFPGGSISTTFSVQNDRLTWSNESFYNGAAGFCMTADGQIYVLFSQSDSPANCTLIGILVFDINHAQQ
ncbi:hypothetical protein LQW54_005869 [Pestalotiopsis sp. IQ-011]